MLGRGTKMKIRDLLLLAATIVLPSLSSAQVVSCDLQFNLRSLDSGIPVNIEFVNETEFFHNIDWIDYQGGFVAYNGLNGGESYTQQTYVGHPWMITDGPGNCKAIFIPQGGDTKYIIRR